MDLFYIERFELLGQETWHRAIHRPCLCMQYAYIVYVD